MSNHHDYLPPNVRLMADWLTTSPRNPAVDALACEFDALGERLASANIRMGGKQAHPIALATGLYHSLDVVISGQVAVAPGGLGPYGTKPEMELCPNKGCGRWRTKK
jgi:hypothetical protein